MNLHAVNACEVNGSIEVWSWDALPAVVGVQAAGTLGVGLNASGSIAGAVAIGGSLAIGLNASGSLAPVAISTSLVPVLHVAPPFAPLLLDTTLSGETILGLAVAGETTVQVGLAGALTRWVLGSGEAIVQFSGVLLGVVVTATQGAGALGIQLSSALRPHIARSGPIKGEFLLNVAALTLLHRIVDSPPAEFRVGLELRGAGHVGAKLPLVGEFKVAHLLRGRLQTQHRVYLAGDLRVGIELDVLRAGVPPIPMEYYPAPRERFYWVPPDAPEEPPRPEYRGV